MTTAPDQLCHLLALLEDESPPVRKEVLKQLKLVGPSLAERIKRMQVTLNGEQMTVLQPLLDEHAREWLKPNWPAWRAPREDKEKLEAALGMVGEFLSSRLQTVTLTDLLDDLTQDFHATDAPVNPMELSRFLFEDLGFAGVAQEDYYNPQNSNLYYVIERKRGIPISLVCIYLLIGHRLGLPIEGCNFPGHFMAITRVEGRGILIDCFNRGRVLDQQDLNLVKARISVKDILRLECRAPAIIARVLRNLSHAFRQCANHDNARLMEELLSAMETAEL
jgi:hypothetical protein